MENKTFVINYEASDETIHKFAATLLLSKYESELILTQGKYAYKVKSGNGGHLYYKKGNTGEWVLIANWCFYGLYIVVRYRKPVWLRPMYETLFAGMNFVATIFDEHSIEIVGTDGQILRSRRFRLSPPSALDKVMSEKFGYAEEKILRLKTELELD
ncbi:MAG: hypothetical protein HYU85_01635 [Chloroflexi bacterium]|nr:hypothetical protein [Chloroflexota bacterium]MBI3930899.1 hypothetical protein [Chloroflexota bacterium]